MVNAVQHPAGNQQLIGRSKLIKTSLWIFAGAPHLDIETIPFSACGWKPCALAQPTTNYTETQPPVWYVHPAISGFPVPNLSTSLAIAQAQ